MTLPLRNNSRFVAIGACTSNVAIATPRKQWRLPVGYLYRCSRSNKKLQISERQKRFAVSSWNYLSFEFKTVREKLKKRKKRTNRRDTKPNALSLLTFLHAFTCIFRRKRIFRKLALTYDDREAALKRKFDPAFSKQLVFRCSWSLHVKFCYWYSSEAVTPAPWKLSRISS